VNKNKVLYFFIHSKNEGEILQDWNLEDTNWDKNKDLKMIIHGFTPLETLHMTTVGISRMKMIKDSNEQSIENVTLL